MLGPFEERVGTGELVRLAAVAARHSSFGERLAGAGDAVSLVLDEAVAGRPAARRALDTVAGRFARGVAAIRAILDPGLVVVGGPMARAGDVLLAALRQHLAGEALNQPELALATLGDAATVHGALQHSLDEVERTRLQQQSPTRIGR